MKDGRMAKALWILAPFASSQSGEATLIKIFRARQNSWKPKQSGGNQCCCSGQPHSCSNPFILPSLLRAKCWGKLESWSTTSHPAATWRHSTRTRSVCEDQGPLQLGSICSTVHSHHRESLPKDAFKKHSVLPQFPVCCCSHKHLGNLNFE